LLVGGEDRCGVEGRVLVDDQGDIFVVIGFEVGFDVGCGEVCGMGDVYFFFCFWGLMGTVGAISCFCRCYFLAV